MGRETFSASSLPWLWMIDAVACYNEVDASVIAGLVEKVLEISDELREKNARETVSLSVLENSSAPAGGLSNGDVATPDSKIGRDPSGRCEDILRLLVRETSASNVKSPGEQMLKWDVESYLVHKRNCSPTFALQQLKDQILSGSNPLLASLMESSGLRVKRQSETEVLVDGNDTKVIGQKPEGRNDSPDATEAEGLVSVAHESGNDLESSLDGNLLPCKRVCNVLPTEDLGRQSHEDQFILGNGCVSYSNAAKKLKLDDTCPRPDVIHNSVSLCGNELIKDSCERIVEHNRKEGCDLSKEFEDRGAEESRILEDGHNRDDTSKRLGYINHVDHANNLHNQNQFHCNDDLVCRDSAAVMQEQNNSIGETKKYNEFSSELRTSNVIPEGEAWKQISADIATDNCEHSLQNISLDDASPAKTQDDVEQNHDNEISSGGDEHHDTLKRLAHISHVDHTNILHTPCQFQCNDDPVSRALAEVMQEQNISLSEAKNYNEVSSELRTSKAVPEGETRKQISADTAGHNCENSLQSIALDDASPGKTQDDVEQNHDNEISGGSDEYHDTSKRLVHISHIDHANTLHTQCQFHCNNDLVSRDPAAAMQEQNISVDEVKKHNEVSSELRPSNVVPEVETQKQISADTVRDNCECSLQNVALDDASPAKTQDDVEQNRDNEITSGSDEHHKTSKRPLHISHVDHASILHNQCQLHCIDDLVPQDPAAAMQERNISVTEAKKYNEVSSELGTSKAIPEGESQKQISADTARDNCEHCLQNFALDDAYPAKTQDDMEQSQDDEISSDSDEYHDGKVDIASKHAFLNASCTYSQDSLVTFQWTELSLCVKCNKGDNVLVCSSDTCPLVVHERCLGYAASFDEQGNFYCPFCTYSRAISKYLAVKKKASLAKKELAVFIGSGVEDQAKKFFRRLHNSEQNQIRQENLNEIDVRSSGKHAACEVEGLAATHGTVHILAANKQEGNKMSQQCESPRRQQNLQTTVQAVHNSELGPDAKIAYVGEGHAEIAMQQGDLLQPVAVLPHEPLCTSIIDGDESSEEENDKSIASNYSMRRRKPQLQYTYPASPLLRRKKLPWTKVEEEALKEGVQRFSEGQDRKIPWKKILEFGGDAFKKSRTAIDLKDKWRNLCRGSPKSK